MLQDIRVNQQSYSGDAEAPLEGIESSPTKTSYFGFKMTNGGIKSKQDLTVQKEYSQESPAIKEAVAAQLAISKIVSEDYSEDLRQMSEQAQPGTINYDGIEDSTETQTSSQLPRNVPMVGKVKADDGNHQLNAQNMLKMGLHQKNQIQGDFSRLSQNSRGSQRSNKTNATSQGGRQHTSMTMNFAQSKKSYKKPKTLRKSSSKNSNQLSSLSASVNINNPSNHNIHQLSQNSQMQGGIADSKVNQQDPKTKAGKLNQYEYKLSDCKDEQIEEYIDSFADPIVPQLDDPQAEHSGLFIQGNSVTAEQIEALDQNLMEMSLCQNHDPQNDGEYMHVDLESQYRQNSNMSKNGEDPELLRLNQYSPDLKHLSNNEMKDIQGRNHVQIDNMDQQFKINKNLKEELNCQNKADHQTPAEFNFTFNQQMNPEPQKQSDLREMRETKTTPQTRERKRCKNKMTKIELFSPINAQREENQSQILEKPKSQINNMKYSSTRNTARPYLKQQMTQAEKPSSGPKQGQRVQSFQLEKHIKPSQIETLDEPLSMDHDYSRGKKNQDFDQQYSMFQGKTKNICLSGLTQPKPQTCQNSAQKAMNFNQEMINQKHGEFNEVKFSNNFIRPKRVSMSPDKKMLMHRHNPSQDIDISSGIYKNHQQSVKLPTIGKQADTSGLHLPQIYKSPQRVPQQDLNTTQLINNIPLAPDSTNPALMKTRRLGNRGQRTQYQAIHTQGNEENSSPNRTKNITTETIQMNTPQVRSGRYGRRIQMAQNQGVMSDQKPYPQEHFDNPQQFQSFSNQTAQSKQMNFDPIDIQNNFRNLNQSMGVDQLEQANYDFSQGQNVNMSMVDQVQSGEQIMMGAQGQQKQPRMFSEDRDHRNSEKSEGVVINGHHRDIKSSNRLPQAFRIFRAKQNVRKIIKSPNNENRSTQNYDIQQF